MPSWPPHRAILRMRARALRNRLSESLLFVPALMVLGAVGLVFLLEAVDRQLPPGALPPFLRLSPDACVQLLSTLAGATVTTVGVVFSLIVVSLQLASAQFSPRVLRSFFREPLAKVVVGLLCAVFVYCVLTLQTLPLAPGPDGQVDVPDLTVNAAVLLTLVSVGVLVMYLHGVSRLQYVGSIVAGITRETVERVAELGREARACRAQAVAAPDLARLGAPYVVRARRGGWVQQVSHEALLSLLPPGSTARLETRPGAFLVEGLPLLSVWPASADAGGLRALEAEVCQAVFVGDARTMQQDVDFGLRQLLDIGLRALSPAVNDPTTAVEVVLHVAAILRPLLLTELPAQARRGDRGVVLLTPWELDHQEYVRHAVDQLRRHAADHPQVAVALARCLRMLLEAVEEAGRAHLRPELERQLGLVLEGVEQAGVLAEDLEKVRAAAACPQSPLRAAQAPRRPGEREEAPRTPLH